MAIAHKDVKKIVGNSKRMRAAQSHIVVNPVTAAEAIAALRKFKATKFDQTVNVVFHLGIDPKAADQALRGSIALPHGIGKTARVIAFCGSDKVAAAKAAGAVEAGSDDLVAKVEGGWMEFDVAIASPDMMRVVSKLGKVLGPKGLMPSPKAGTVTPNVADAVKEYAAGNRFSNTALDACTSQLELNRAEIRAACEALKTQGRVIYQGVRGKGGAHYEPLSFEVSSNDPFLN